MQSWTRADKIAFWGLVIGAVSCIAAVASIPMLNNAQSQDPYSLTDTSAVPVSSFATPAGDTAAERVRNEHSRFEGQLIEEQRLAESEANLRLYQDRMRIRRERMEGIARDMTASNRRLYTISLSNRCNQTINVAINFRDLDNKWMSRGWWVVEPFATMQTNVKTDNSVVYFFANTTAGLRWEGQDSLSLHRAFPPIRFDLIDGEANPYPTTDPVVLFRRAITTSDDYTQEFTCESQMMNDTSSK